MEERGGEEERIRREEGGGETLRIEISLCLMFESFPVTVLSRICFTATGVPLYREEST